MAGEYATLPVKGEHESVLRRHAVLLSGVALGPFVLVEMLFLFYTRELERGGGVLAAVMLFALAVAGVTGAGGRRFRTALLVFALLVIAIWWSSIRATGIGPWQEREAILARADIDGNLVTIHNIRDFDYTRNGGMIPHYYDRTFDLNAMSSVDLFAVYWMGDAIAHIIVSFGFSERDFVAFSIEARKRKGQAFSNLAGFFKNYELMYVVADERDLIRYRTTYESPAEQVYLFRMPLQKSGARDFFLEYLRRVNRLAARPEFYNTLTTNCTTNVFFQARALRPQLRYNWMVFLSGYFPQYLYYLDPKRFSLPFEDLKEAGHINERAVRSDGDPAFSRRIREGVPYHVLLEE